MKFVALFSCVTLKFAITTKRFVYVNRRFVVIWRFALIVLIGSSFHESHGLIRIICHRFMFLFVIK